MKFFIRVIFILVYMVPLSGQRYLERINFDWKFYHGEIKGAENFDFDDSGWQTVHLPHDASITGPFFKDSLNADRSNGFLPRSKGWYRKFLTLDQDITGKKIFIEFEGIYRDAHIFVNGKEAGQQLNGYESFLVDITIVAKQGNNVIAVFYDNTDMESSRWYNGEGIYRDVWLIITAPVHVDYNGTYIWTSDICNEKASVFIQTEVFNETAENKEVTVKSEIFSPDLNKIKEVVSTVPLAAGELYYFKQYANIQDPELWDLDSPNLYKVVTSIIDKDNVVDNYESTFGIRNIEFDRDKGLLLNNKKVLVKGVNIHHDLGPLGAAAFERGYERRLEGLKKLGCNGFRLSHNPHDKYILDWCDRNGILVIDEAFDKWQNQFFGRENNFNDHWEASLEAFIKRDRNHPSVFLWSVGNETHQQRSSRYDFGVPQLKEMVDFVHSFEPSRKVTCGLHPSRKGGAYRTENYYREGPPEMVFYMDVVSTNYREEFWPVDKANYPQLSFILSEAQVGNLGNEWFNFNHDNSIGLFYWGGTDYIGESFGWPSKGWPNGIIDWNDHWKPFSYYIHSLFSEEPMVHIAVYDPGGETTKYWNEVQLKYQPLFSHWNWQGKDSVRILTMCNGQEVELFINGRSIGIKKVPEEYFTNDIKAYTAEEYDPDNPVNTGPKIHKNLEWIVPFEPGIIKAECKVNGKVAATHELKTSGDAVRILLEPDREIIKADCLDLAYITVKVVDKNNILVPGADHKITFEVKGAGSNIGLASADVASGESFVGNQRKVFQGKALLVIRADRTPGIIEVKATADGLQPAKLKIRAE